MMRRYGFILGLMGAFLIGDQATKLWVARVLPYGQPVSVLPYAWLTYVHNPGAAFSMMAAWPLAVRIPFFTAATLLALAALAWMSRTVAGKDRMSEWGLGLVAAGAVGNLIDRLRLGSVIDFVEIGVRDVYTWPVFNVADACINVGVGLLLLRMLRPLPEPK
jgi:signal peptidase II